MGGIRQPRAVVALAAVLAGSACQPSSTEPDQLVPQTVEGFAGLAAADAPQVASAGRAVLANNGTAPDAAVAMALTAAVTMPSRAGLGGGGACVIHRRKTGETRALVFPATGPGNVAAPVLPRALARLHDRHGRLPWARLVRPAHRLARDGFQVSAALNADIQSAASRLGDGIRRMLARPDGALPSTGRIVKRPGLAATLRGMRQRGAGYVYTDPFLPRFLTAADAAAGGLNAATVRGVRASFVETVTVRRGDGRLHLPPPPALGALAVAQTARMLATQADLPAGAGPRRMHALIEAVKRARSQQAAWLADADGRPSAYLAEARVRELMDGYKPDAATPAASLTPEPLSGDAVPPGTGFTVADRFGNAVACGLTMNGLFGSGQLARGTGVVLAPATKRGAGLAGLAPALMTTSGGGAATGALTATGGGAAPSALIQVLGRLRAGAGLPAAVTEPRVDHPGMPDVARVEPDAGRELRAALKARGHTMRRADALGRVTGFVCDGPVHASATTCDTAADPRGGGLALRVE